MDTSLLPDEWVGMLEAILKTGTKELPESEKARAINLYNHLKAEREKRHLAETLLTLQTVNDERHEPPTSLDFADEEEDDLAMWQTIMDAIRMYDWILGPGVPEYLDEVSIALDFERTNRELV